MAYRLTERPAFLTDAHLTYLDDLRVSGATNMYGATPYLMRRFGMPEREARVILQFWMDTFGDRHP